MAQATALDSPARPQTPLFLCTLAKVPGPFWADSRFSPKYFMATMQKTDKSL
jgi:hypothetical protein